MDMSALDLKTISAAAAAAGITEPSALIGFALGFAASQFQVSFGICDRIEIIFSNFPPFSASLFLLLLPISDTSKPQRK